MYVAPSPYTATVLQNTSLPSGSLQLWPVVLSMQLLLHLAGCAIRDRHLPLLLWGSSDRTEKKPRSDKTIYSANHIVIDAVYLRWDILRGLDTNRGVPLPWWQDCHLVQELIYPSQQVTSVLGLVRYIMEDLEQRDGRRLKHNTVINLVSKCVMSK